MKKEELAENLRKTSAGNINEDPTTRNNSEILKKKHPKNSTEKDFNFTERLGKTVAGAMYEDPAMEKTQEETEEQMDNNK
ncbi:hypothetical protein [Enterococcus sp. AZ072]|uniref:hypothetical protein n=1 Tax=unclassified Enterococcus TaxID=2608891 RepID=UPI003D26F67F